jgi:hypothetical protein
MQDLGVQNRPPAPVPGLRWVRGVLFIASNLLYAFAMIIARIILGSTGFRELLTTLELP